MLTFSILVQESCIKGLGKILTQIMGGACLVPQVSISDRAPASVSDWLHEAIPQPEAYPILSDMMQLGHEDQQ